MSFAALCPGLMAVLWPNSHVAKKQFSGKTYMAGSFDSFVSPWSCALG